MLQTMSIHRTGRSWSRRAGSLAPRLTRLALLLLALAPAGVRAEPIRVVTVPFVGMDRSVPHPAYNGHRTIFKAIARNADDTRPASCTVLKYRWNITGAIDAQGNDIWSDCYANAHGGAQNAATKWITVSATVNSKRDPYRLDCRASLPTVDPGQVKKKIFTAKIQVDCDGALAYGSYPIIVHAEVGQGIDLKTDPEVDPRGVVPDAVNDVVRAGPDDGEWELDVKRQVAIDDALWWLHGNTSRSGSGNALTTGWSVTDKWEAAGGAYLWAMAQNGHFPAYPPGTYDDGGEGIPRVMRDNDQRWRHDPYAEDAARYLNFVLSCIRQGNTDAAAESNVVDGVDRGETIPGTDDGKGFNLVYKNSYELGHVLGGLGACGMGGSVAQVGQNYVKGKRLEYVVQQMVDWLSKTQIRSNNNPALKQNPDGAWIYTTYSGNDGHQADASTSQWVLIGLESADRGMKELGVIVPDGVKYRTANFLHRNMKRLNNQYRGAGSYRNSYNDDNGHETHLAGGLLVGLGWLGVNHWVTDGPGWNEVPSGYSGYTRKQLKADTYDVILDYEARAFFCNETKTSHHSWNGCAFADRNARWGVKSDATAVSLGRGNVYTMYSIQKGARTIEPELTHFVSGDIRIDWYREYTYYFVNNQEDDGSIASKWTNTHADWYADDVGNTVAWGEVLVQTPTLFDPKPVAIGSATPLQVVEGCSGVQQPVSFRHELSYHQSPQRVMVEYQWIFGTADKGAGESWNAYFNRIFGATPQIVPDPTALDPLDEYVTAGGEVIGWHGRDRLRLPGKVWERAGVYTAALRIVDDKGITNVTTVEGITVVPQPAVEPAVSAGGPYFLRSGEELELEGSGWDDNESCGDGITFTWSIRPGEEWIPLFSDVDDPVQTVGWELFADLPRGVAIPLRLEATDGTGNTAKADTELTLFDIHPIACFSAEPATVGCQEPVTVNGSCSSHEDPRQRVIKWEWDFESDGTVDAIGEVLQHGYQLVGSYWIHLLASDELGITGETKRQVTVEPRRSPVASAGGPYKLATWLDEQGRRVGGALALNGSGSSDPDRDCGDRIVLYEWDVNGDGLFNDGVQSDQPRLGVTWATLLARLQGRPEAEWLAGPTGQPSVSIRLRVTDSSGRSHVDLTTLSIHHNAPYALFSANPQQASCLGSITFDASASYHGMPPHQINSYQWDFDVKEGEAFVPEAFGRVVIHEYDNFGIYHPVLRVVDDQVPGKVALRHGEVIVQTGNHAPEVDPGGPYTVVVGGELRLDASATREPDAACGDAITGYAWDLDGDGEYDDAQGATPRVAWNVLTTLLRPDQYPADPRTGLPQVVIRVRVTDSFGAAAVGSTVLTVYPREPVAVAYWQPQPVVPVDPITRKGVVTLDGRWSYPGNPGAGKPGCRLPGDCLFSYSWAVEGVTVANGAQVQVERSFPDLGQLPRTLRFKLTVIDLADARDEVEFQVTFGQLASAPPRVSFVEGNELHLAPGDRLYVRGVVTDPDFVPGNPNSGWIAKVMWDLDGVAESPEDIERPLRDTNGDGNIDGLDQPDTLLDLAWADLAQFGLQAPGEHTIMLQALDKTNVLGQAPLKLVVHPAAMVAVALAVPSSGGCTTTFELDGSSSRHLFPGTSIAQHRWDFESDGTTDATGALVTHTFRRFGVFQTKLEVLDLKGHSASTTVQLSTREGNVPPVGLHGGPYFVDTTLPDASLVLDATGSFDPDAACSDRIVEYRWDLDADGVHEHRFAGPQNTLTLAQLAYLPQSQLLPITLEVADAQGGQAQVQTTLIVSDGTPLALFGFAPEPSACGQQVSFDASASFHPRPDRRIVRQEWDFAYDGSFDAAAQAGALVKYTFPSMGQWQVALRVTDDSVPPRSAILARTATVSMDNLPPLASTGGQIRAVHGEALQLDGRASSDPNAGCGDAVVKYEWDLDANGSWDFSSAVGLLTVGWAQVVAVNPGYLPADRTGQPSYPLRLRVTDKAGATGSVDTRVVFYDPLPVARPAVQPETVGCQQDMLFSGASSYTNHPARKIVRYIWEFGDGSAVVQTSQPEVVHRYARMNWVNGSAAPYKARLVVQDDVLPPHSSPAAEVNATLRFLNRSPVADAGGPYLTSRIGDQVTPIRLDGSGSYDPDVPCDAILTYAWDTDNDGLFGAEDVGGSPYCSANSDCVGAVVDRFYSDSWQNGTRIPVLLRVSDSYGASTVSEVVYIEVTDTAPPMVQLSAPNGGEVLAGNAAVSFAYGIVSATGAKWLELQLLVNNEKITLLDPDTALPLCGQGCNTLQVQADGLGTMIAGRLRFDTRAFPSKVDSYRLQIVAAVRDNPALKTSVISRRAFTIDNQPPTIQVTDNRLQPYAGNLLTFRFDGRAVSNVQSVRLSGSFNGWSEENLDDEWRMRDGNLDAIWLLTRSLGSGDHLYRFLVFKKDGSKVWLNDALNPVTGEDPLRGSCSKVTAPVTFLQASLEQLALAGTRFVLQGVTVGDGLDPNPGYTLTHSTTDQLWGLDRVYPLGTTKMTFVARDWAGNIAAMEVAVRITDVTKPTVATGPPVAQEATNPAGTPVKLQPMFWDLCDSQLLVQASATDAQGQPVAIARNLDGSYSGAFPLGRTTVLFSAEDDSGNVSSATVTVTMSDSTPPTILLDVPLVRVSQSSPQGTPSQEVLLPAPTLLDNGSQPAQMTCTATMTLIEALGGGQANVAVSCGTPLPAGFFFPPGETEVIFTVRDVSGNESQATLVVLVTDPDAPEVVLVSPPRSDIWYRDPVTVRFLVTDATDPNPSITVEPMPAGQQLVLQNGVYSLLFSADGIHRVRIQVADAQGNQSMALVPSFGIDRTAPQVSVRDLPVEGVLQGDESTYPLFFTGESMSPIFSAADGISGIQQVSARIVPGSGAGELVLFNRDIVLSGAPPVGRLVMNDLRCTDRAGVCLAGDVRLRTLRNGVQRIYFIAVDGIGNVAQLALPFRMSNLDEAIGMVLGKLAGYRQQHAQLAGKLVALESLLVTGRISLRRGYLGGCLISIEDAVKAMETDFVAGGVKFAALPGLERDASLLVRGAYSETHIYWEDEALGTIEEHKSLDYLDAARQAQVDRLYSKSVLACENAYFYARNAAVPFRAIDPFTSLNVLEVLIDQTASYLVFDELPAQADVYRADERLRTIVEPAFTSLRDFGWLGARIFMNLLLQLQDLGKDLRRAENQGTWVRNWQWGIGQMIRVVVDVAKAEAEAEIMARCAANPGQPCSTCRLAEAQQQYDDGMAMLDARDVDEMLKLYASDHIRCLMLYIYKDARYVPAFPPEAYGCWVDAQGNPPPCP